MISRQLGQNCELFWKKKRDCYKIKTNIDLRILFAVVKFRIFSKWIKGRAIFPYYSRKCAFQANLSQK